MYVGCNGAGCIHILKTGFLRKLLNSALEKYASKRAKAMYA
jgi:hypothetical protein